MGRLYLLLGLANLALLVIALIGCLSAEEHEIRALPRLAWVFIILLFSPIGAIAWFVAGRPQRDAAGPATGRAKVWRAESGFPEPTRPRKPIAPDDDPEFLRTLSAKNRRDEEEMMRRWEEDLQRREEELRRKPKDEDPPPN